MDGITNYSRHKVIKLLTNVGSSQRSISNVAEFCLANRAHSKEIVAMWSKIYKNTSDDEKKLILLYTANHILQYSRQEEYDFMEIWASALPSAFHLVKEERVNFKILRVLHIWRMRDVYNEQFLNMLTSIVEKSILEMNASSDLNKKSLEIRIEYCKQMEKETKSVFEALPNQLIYNINDIKLPTDKNALESVFNKLNQSKKAVTNYNNHLRTEIICRKLLTSKIEHLMEFFDSEMIDAKKVQKAYTIYACNMKKYKKDLDLKIQSMNNLIISEAVNSPSPEPIYTITLPDD